MDAIGPSILMISTASIKSARNTTTICASTISTIPHIELNTKAAVECFFADFWKAVKVSIILVVEFNTASTLDAVIVDGQDPVALGLARNIISYQSFFFNCYI